MNYVQRIFPGLATNCRPSNRQCLGSLVSPLTGDLYLNYWSLIKTFWRQLLLFLYCSGFIWIELARIPLDNSTLGGGSHPMKTLKMWDLCEVFCKDDYIFCEVNTISFILRHLLVGKNLPHNTVSRAPLHVPKFIRYGHIYLQYVHQFI